MSQCLLHALDRVDVVFTQFKRAKRYTADPLLEQEMGDRGSLFPWLFNRPWVHAPKRSPHGLALRPSAVPAQGSNAVIT